MRSTISESLIANQVFSTMQAAGIIPKDDNLLLVMDGEIHRFAVESDRWGATSGAYIIHADNWPHWFLQDYHQHSSMLHFSFDKEALSIEERRAYYQEQNNAYQFNGTKATQTEKAKAQLLQRKKQEAEEKEKQQAISRACYLYEKAFVLNVSKHPYIEQRFISKGIPVCHFIMMWEFEEHIEITPPFNALKRANIEKPIGRYNAELIPSDLLVPITNVMTQKIQSLQIISDKPNSEGKYQKGFLKGTSPKGGCYELIPPNSENAKTVYLCEGLCTGIAIVILTRGLFPVFCAMTSGNLEHVARGLRERYSDKKIFIMADNDAATAIKTGTNTGIKAAHAVKDKGLADRVKFPQLANRQKQNIDWYDVLAERINHNA